MPFPICCVLILCLAGFAPTRLVAETAPAVEPFHLNRHIEKVDPMQTEGLDPRIAGILDRYYLRSFGGPENWAGIESIKFEGVLTLANGARLRFTAFKKKPDRAKVVLDGPSGEQVVLAYDGREAWQLITAQSDDPAEMPPAEALNFIRDAPIATHLLYPQLPGKQIELLDSLRVAGELCYQLRVTLPNGQGIRYAIGATDYTVRQQAALNELSGKEEVLTYADTRPVEGVAVAFTNRTEVDGAFVHRVELEHVAVNLGVMPWMFSHRSGAYLPTGRTRGGVIPEVAPAEPSLGGDSGTAFPDLSESERESILEELGLP